MRLPARKAIHCVQSLLLLALAAFGWLTLAGCMGKSPSVNFYILSSIPEQQEPGRPGPSTEQLRLGIGPLTLADYLEQPKLVTRSGDNQLVRAEFEQWGGSFKDNIATVLAENLGYLLATEQLHLYPWRLSTALDYQVMLDIVRLDGSLGEEVWLVARWSIVDGREKSVILTRRSTISEEVGGGGYAALANAESRALASLSREIAKSIEALPRP